MLRTFRLPLLAAVALLVSCSAQAQPVSLLILGTPTTARPKPLIDPLPTSSTGPRRSKRTNGTGFQIGLRGGIDYVTYIKDKPGVDFSRDVLGHGGLVLNTGGRTVSFQPEFIYNRIALKFSDSGGTVKSSAGQLEVPLLLKFATGSPASSRFFIVLGPYAGYALSNKSTVTLGGQTYTFSGAASGTFRDRFNYGATAGLGVAIPAGRGQFTLEARGLLPLGTVDEFRTGSALILQGSIGYLFSLGGR